MVLRKPQRNKMHNPLETPRHVHRQSRAPSNVNVESQTEHKFCDHSGLHSESKPFLVPEVKVGMKQKKKGVQEQQKSLIVQPLVQKLYCLHCCSSSSPITIHIMNPCELSSKLTVPANIYKSLHYNMKYESYCIRMGVDMEQSPGSMFRCKSNNWEIIFCFTLFVHVVDGLLH